MLAKKKNSAFWFCIASLSVSLSSHNTTSVVVASSYTISKRSRNELLLNLLPNHTMNIQVASSFPPARNDQEEEMELMKDTSTNNYTNEKVEEVDDDEEVDDRPLLSDLLAKHSSHLDEMRQLLQKDPSYNQAVSLSSSSSSSPLDSSPSSSYTYKYDEVWMLRFWLSHKPSIKKATKAALRTIQFRKEYQLDELGDIRYKIGDHCKTIQEHTEDDMFDIHRKYSECCTSRQAVMHTLPDINRGLISYITPEYINQPKIVKELTHEDVKCCYLYGNEIAYQIVDDITRRTNRLTKCLRIMEVSNITWQRDVNLSYLKLDAAATKDLEDYYPQLLGCVLIVNPPRWINIVWNMAGYLLPQRFVDKLKMIQCPPMMNKNHSKTKNKNKKSALSSIKKKKKKDHHHPTVDIAQYFTNYISRSNLSERYGGKNTEWPPASACHQFIRK